MTIVESAYATLQQEGYKPRIGENGALVFSYYGQPATFRKRSMGSVSFGELECVLPLPEPETASVMGFQTGRPLCRLSGRDGQAVLTLETMLIEQEVGLQLRSLVRLMDQYSADYVWKRDRPALPDPTGGTEFRQEQQAVPETVRESFLSGVQQQERPASGSIPAAEVLDEPSEPAPLTGTTIPEDWEQVWPLLSPRFHPLATALAHLGAPAPQEVQMDMVQGHQVRGTAIMLWGTPPDAVVVCEQGQIIPSGYQGSTWYKHQTAEQVAQETMAYLKLARLA